MIFKDLSKQYEALRPKMERAILDVASSTQYIMGPQVQALEERLAAYVGVKHCLTCANGTDALTLALKAWGIGRGDAVFVPDFTFFASAEVVALESATPVFVDVDAATYNIDPVSLETAIEKVESEGLLRPRAVIAVDLFGLPADFAAIRKIADRHGMLILEDGAQGFGGSIGGKKACSFGDISTTSFFPAKPLPVHQQRRMGSPCGILPRTRQRQQQIRQRPHRPQLETRHHAGRCTPGEAQRV